MAKLSEKVSVQGTADCIDVLGPSEVQWSDGSAGVIVLAIDTEALIAGPRGHDVVGVQRQDVPRGHALWPLLHASTRLPPLHARVAHYPKDRYRDIR